MRPLPPPEIIGSVQLIRESAMGDVVLCEPALAALARRYPGARLSLVTRAAYHPLFAAHPAVAQLATLEEAWRAPAPDLAIDLQNRLRTRRLAGRARHRRHWRKRTGLDLVRAVGGRPLHRDYRGGPHQIERIAGAMGLTTDRSPRLTMSSAARQAAQRWQPATCFAALLPAAGHPTKRWPPERFAALGAALRARGLEVLVVGGPGEEPLLAEVARHIGTVVPTWVPLDHLAALLAGAAVVIGNDTGLLHVAAGVGAPCVGLFGPTSPGRWGPPPGVGVAVARDLPCAPCSDYGGRRCSRGDQACLRALSADSVLGVIDDLAKISRTVT